MVPTRFVCINFCTVDSSVVTAMFMEGYRSLMAASDYTGEVTISGGGMSYVRLMLVGTLMLVSLILNPKGLLPEVPSRPERPSEDTV